MAVVVDFFILTVQVFGHILHALIQWVKKPREKLVRNNICLITGAASANGIGRLFALEFARRGAILVLWDVDAEGNESTAQEVRKLGAKAYTYTCDVSRKEVVYGAADCVRREVGHVSILVNNAGIVSGKSILQCPDEQLERTMRTNCHAHFWVSTTLCHTHCWLYVPSEQKVEFGTCKSNTVANFRHAGLA